MRKAFHPDSGPLTDKALVPAEREAEMHLFRGAIGHAKNPASHRDVAMSAPEAARLILFASHLFDRRAPGEVGNFVSGLSARRTEHHGYIVPAYRARQLCHQLRAHAIEKTPHDRVLRSVIQNRVRVLLPDIILFA